jgi:hypothetical protein
LSTTGGFADGPFYTAVAPLLLLVVAVERVIFLLSW